MSNIIETISGLVGFWDFQDPSLTSRGPRPIKLTAHGEPLEYVKEGVWGDSSLRFRPTESGLARSYLVATSQDAPELSISGPEAEVTVVAWVKREPSEYKGCEFVAGVWNEHKRRQYGLFLNLRIWDSSQQVCAHISSHGGATPGYPYCMDAAISQTAVPTDEWQCIGFTYDSKVAKAYLNGKVDVREPVGELGANPLYYEGGLHDGGADFTVGAVARPEKVTKAENGEGFVEKGSAIGNPFVGLLGGLAIFNRALSEEEMFALAKP